MVKPNPFLDKKVAQPVSSQLQNKSRLTGRVTDVLDGGRVEVEFDDDGEVVGTATGLTGGGLTAIGAEVQVYVDPVTGKVTSVGDPIIWPEDSEPVATGSTGAMILDTAMNMDAVTQAQLDVAEAQAELVQAQENLQIELDAANERMDEAAEEMADELDGVLEDMENVRDATNIELAEEIANIPPGPGGWGMAETGQDLVWITPEEEPDEGEADGGGE